MRGASPKRGWRSVLGALVIVVAGLAAGCSVNGKGRRYYVVSPPIAFSMLRDTPDLTILDLRSHQEFTGGEGHLYRAVNIPLDELAERVGELVPYRDTTFLVYCRGEVDDCGPRGMEILRGQGYEDAILIAGGLAGWRARGYGTVGAPGAMADGEREPRPAPDGGLR